MHKKLSNWKWVDWRAGLIAVHAEGKDQLMAPSLPLSRRAKKTPSELLLFCLQYCLRTEQGTPAGSASEPCIPGLA